MEKEEKHNPNPHERLRPDTPKSWSELPQDLLKLVFETLSFANFQRAKSVCSSWHSASRQSVPKNQIPWLILLPKDNNNSCTLFNPEEKDKLYKTQDLGVELSKTTCIATYGSWLLMQVYPNILYIANLFTHEIISLPLMESQLGTTQIKQILDRGSHLRSPVFWIDEKTKDYVVLWGSIGWCVVYSKKGDDNLWKQIPETSSCYHMVYVDHKLYFLTESGDFSIFDFSGEFPQEIFTCYVRVERFEIRLRSTLYATKIVVRVTGEVLKVEKFLKKRSKTWFFKVHKVSSPRFPKKKEVVDSLGDEAMLFDQGITVLANDVDGFVRDSIYFSSSHQNTHELFLFDLKTRKTELLHEFDSSSIQFSRARWFSPSFTSTMFV